MTCGLCRRVNWADLKGQLDRVPSKLIASLDKVFSKSKQKYLFHVTYPYGQLIVDNGRFIPPCKRDLCSECRALADETRYSQVPLALLTNNPIEVFFDFSQRDNGTAADKAKGHDLNTVAHPKDEYHFRLAPLRLIPSGELFGVFETLDASLGLPSSRPGWSVSAGSRSVWVLAPLGNKLTIRELGHQLAADIYWNSEDNAHWELIQQCAEAKGIQWCADLLVFPAAVIEQLTQTSELLTELLLVGWRYSSPLRNSSIEDRVIRDAVSRAARRVTLPVGETHFQDAMRHFLNMVAGLTPAYRSSHLIKEPAGPFVSFCDILDGVWPKRQYTTVVMQPHHLAPGEAGYYSCRCPSIPVPAQPKPDTFLSLTEAYRDVINNFHGEYAQLLNSRSVTFFGVPPAPRCPECKRVLAPGKACPKCKVPGRELMPRGVTSIDKVLQTDFGSGTQEHPVYLKSQFLVSCLRLTREEHHSVAATAGPLK